MRPSGAAATLLLLTQVAEQPLHRALGLTDGEFDRIRELLAREPNHFELAVFSLLWSEHCGYKHSALLLKGLPSAGARVLQGPGENAGVIDLGGGEAVAFKVESHNHPSAVEPFQGAATGVGGILRDIIAMGARPVALLDGLRFGADDWHFDRAVAGVGHYGNCLAGDEHLLFRNGGKVRSTTIGELCEERGAAGQAWTVEPSKPFQVLSVDPATMQPAWRDVSRVFKRRADRLIRIETTLGRKISVSADHPVMLWDGGLVERRADQVQPGDRVPLLCALPYPESPLREIDLIDEIEDESIVRLPETWLPTDECRIALRRVLPRSDQRHYWIKRRELPVAAFRAVEGYIGVPRGDLRLRLDGPRSNSVPAVFPLNERTARLVGFFLAEGCCYADGSTIRLIWTFGRSKQDRRSTEDLHSILEELGVRYRVEQRSSTVATIVSSRLLGRLFRDVLGCGTHAEGKRIPPQLFEQPLLRLEALKGIFRGDGSASFGRKRGHVRIAHSTTSSALHDQILLSLQSEGIVAARYERAGGSATIAGRLVTSLRSYQVEIVGAEAVARASVLFDDVIRGRILRDVAPHLNSPHSRPRAVMDGTIATVAVKDVVIDDGETAVYDFEVPGTHLFVTSGGIVTHNCTGVPNVGGEVVFDEAYAGNCLVNAMCVGLLPTERVLKAKATGVGNVLVLYGATTGRDGIGGASVLASQELGEGQEEKRPSVQVGDPFTGKRLIEVSQELVERELVAALQDCGAAGLASSLSEMAAGGAGVDVHLDRVPLREPDLEPWEVMISESQERMVAVVRPELVDEVVAVCERWELHVAAIGEVTDTGRLRALWGGEVVGDLEARLLTDECPRYRVETRPRPVEPAPPPAPVLADANLRSRAWVYRQYDHLVGSRTVRRPGLDAAVLRLRPSLRGLAVSLDGPPVGERDPWRAGLLAVLDAARNVACAGGEPLALTDCLNFGNPEKPEIAWELERAIAGIAEAANALGIPVVSGNVSLYNETDGRAIPPTPVVGCVGLVADVRQVPHGWREGDAIYLLAAPDAVDLAAEAALVERLWRIAPQASLVHDVSDGGLRVALAEAALWSGVGADVDVPDEPLGGAAIVAGVAVDGLRIGTVGGTRILGSSLDDLRSDWST